MPVKTATTDPSRYEFRVGVTGHRELPDAVSARSVIDDLLKSIDNALQLATDHPAGSRDPKRGFLEGLERDPARALITAVPITSSRAREVLPELRAPVRWTVVSPLAKGADRIVARAALERVDAELEVITPFPLEHYKRDFEDPADLAEFEELYRRSTKQQHMNGDEAEGSSEAIGASVQKLGYLSVGIRVVESCDLLLAVWDGEPPRPKSIGSTAQIVEIARSRGRRVLWVNSIDPESPIKMSGGTDWIVIRTDAKLRPAT